MYAVAVVAVGKDLFLAVHQNSVGLYLACLAGNYGEKTPAVFGLAVAEKDDFLIGRGALSRILG